MVGLAWRGGQASRAVVGLVWRGGQASRAAWSSGSVPLVRHARTVQLSPAKTNDFGWLFSRDFDA